LQITQKEHGFTDMLDALPRSAWDPLLAALNQQVTMQPLSACLCTIAIEYQLDGANQQVTDPSAGSIGGGKVSRRGGG
jgi:hypothetical protein